MAGATCVAVGAALAIGGCAFDLLRPAIEQGVASVREKAAFDVMTIASAAPALGLSLASMRRGDRRLFWAAWAIMAAYAACWIGMILYLLFAWRSW